MSAAVPLFDLGPGIPQRNRAVEDGAIRLGIDGIDREVTQSLELPMAPGLRLPANFAAAVDIQAHTERSGVPQY